LYLRERRKRRENDDFMMGFLHGIKPMVEAAARRDSAWKGFVPKRHGFKSVCLAM
jgi:hypothetical protein